MDNNDYEEDNQTGDFNEEEEVFENAKEIAVENKVDVKEKVGSQPKQPGTKQKRRSKNDCIGRDYVCGCGKTYLSYPALYTHIKTKHNGKTPEGTNANQVQTGNGNSRGRPRKNFLTNEDSKSRRNRDNNRKEMTLDERNNELRELLNKKNVNVDSIRENENCYFEIYRSFDLLKKEKEKEIMKGHSSKGNENYNEFSEDFNENNEMSVDSEEEEKKEQNNEAQNANKKQEAEDKEENYNVLDAFPTINIEQGINTSYLQLYSQVKLLLNDPAKNQHNSKKNEEAKVITCDEAFGMFLIEMSKSVKIEFLRLMIVLIKTYRDCMNKLGWEILSQYKPLKEEKTNLEFCSVKDPSRLPEIANDFVKTYLPANAPKFDYYFSVIIVSHFNFWLFKNNYTLINLSADEDIFLLQKKEA